MVKSRQDSVWIYWTYALCVLDSVLSEIEKVNLDCYDTLFQWQCSKNEIVSRVVFPVTKRTAPYRDTNSGAHCGGPQGVWGLSV